MCLARSGLLPLGVSVRSGYGDEPARLALGFISYTTNHVVELPKARTNLLESVDVTSD